jgi:hypothetical protein
MTLTDKQTGVFKGMVAGLAITVASLGFAIFGLESPVLVADASLAHAIKWDTLVVACLAVNIALLARHRFFTPDDIDGGGLSKGTPTAQILQSTLQNTLEQTVLALAVHAVWSSVMPPTWQLAIPAASILFIVGRILFWRGYARGAPARALGFGLTFYPSLLMLLVIVFRIVLVR